MEANNVPKIKIFRFAPHVQVSITPHRSGRRSIFSSVDEISARTNKNADGDIRAF
jgi:hypothetical protein